MKVLIKQEIQYENGRLRPVFGALTVDRYGRARIKEGDIVGYASCVDEGFGEGSPLHRWADCLEGWVEAELDENGHIKPLNTPLVASLDKVEPQPLVNLEDEFETVVGWETKVVFIEDNKEYAVGMVKTPSGAWVVRRWQVSDGKRVGAAERSLSAKYNLRKKEPAPEMREVSAVVGITAHGAAVSCDDDSALFHIIISGKVPTYQKADINLEIPSV